MPRDDDPRVVVRMTPEDHAALKATAELNDLAVGALVRECAIRYASTVARELRVSGKRLRRGNVVVPGSGPARSVAKSRPVPRPAVKPIEGLRRASELVGDDGPEGWALARQAKLNEARVRPAKKKRGGS
jgi:hypothetical protein